LKTVGTSHTLDFKQTDFASMLQKAVVDNNTRAAAVVRKQQRAQRDAAAALRKVQ
jgi:hypothetical protein